MRVNFIDKINQAFLNYKAIYMFRHVEKIKNLVDMSNRNLIFTL